MLLVSDRSLLPVLVAAKPGASILTRFVDALGSMLARLGVPPDAVRGELEAMKDVRIGPTRNRRVLGTMTDFARMLDSYAARDPSLESVALHLAEAPCGPIAMRSPMDLAVELLASGE